MAISKSVSICCCGQGHTSTEGSALASLPFSCSHLLILAPASARSLWVSCRWKVAFVSVSCVPCPSLPILAPPGPVSAVAEACQGQRLDQCQTALYLTRCKQAGSFLQLRNTEGASLHGSLGTHRRVQLPFLVWSCMSLSLQPVVVVAG